MKQHKRYVILIVISIAVAIIASYFASGFPDGLEWSAQKLSISEKGPPLAFAPFKEYETPWSGLLSKPLASLIGITAVFLLALLTFKFLSKKKRRASGP